MSQQSKSRERIGQFRCTRRSCHGWRSSCHGQRKEKTRLDWPYRVVNKCHCGRVSGGSSRRCGSRKWNTINACNASEQFFTEDERLRYIILASFFLFLSLFFSFFLIYCWYMDWISFFWDIMDWPKESYYYMMDWGSTTSLSSNLILEIFEFFEDDAISPCPS